MGKVTVKNYQELAMRTCLPSARNFEYYRCLIVSELGEAFGKWGKKFRDGEFDKDKLTDELGDVFWGVALGCELGGYDFEELWDEEEFQAQKVITFPMPNFFKSGDWIVEDGEALGYLNFAKTFAKECGIDPLECLKRNIAKLAGRKERGTIGGNGGERWATLN